MSSGTWRVTDREAYDAYCYKYGAVDSEEEMVWTRLDPDDYWQARTYLKQHFPELFVYSEQSMDPNDLLVHCSDGIPRDSQTGKQVPGVEWVPEGSE